MKRPVAASLVSATGARAGAPDPKVMSVTLPDHRAWVDDPVKGPLIARRWGDPARPGPYAILVRWPPHQMSRPRTHPFDPRLLVVSGVWWVGSGANFDPGSTTPAPAGSSVTHFAGQAHDDGAKDEAAVIEIVG